MNLPDIILMAAWIQLRPAYKYIYGLFDSHFMSHFQHETFKNNPTNLVNLTFFVLMTHVFQFQHDQKKKKITW